MYFSQSIALIALAASAQAWDVPSLTRRNTTATSGGCPAVWTDFSSELTGLFLSDGQCNDNARAAIRAVFHDCFPQGGCDGSLAFPEELARSDNSPMTSTVNALKALADKYSVGVADMLMFAGCKSTVPSFAI